MKHIHARRVRVARGVPLGSCKLGEARGCARCVHDGEGRYPDGQVNALASNVQSLLEKRRLQRREVLVIEDILAVPATARGL